MTRLVRSYLHRGRHRAAPNTHGDVRGLLRLVDAAIAQAVYRSRPAHLR